MPNAVGHETPVVLLLLLLLLLLLCMCLDTAKSEPTQHSSWPHHVDIDSTVLRPTTIITTTSTTSTVVVVVVCVCD